MLALPGPDGPIEARRDTLGYPSIRARNPDEAAWARGWFHAVDRQAQCQLTLVVGQGRLMECLGDAPLTRLVDRWIRALDLSRGLADAVAAWRPETLGEDALRGALHRAWPRARARLARGAWWAPVRRRFHNIFTMGKEPPILGFCSPPVALRGGPTSPFQARILSVAGQDMVGGSACHLVFDTSRPGGWYNIRGGASERRFGAGYGKGLDAWGAGTFLPLGQPESPPPHL